ncbi:allantoate amidohydrolase [Nonomuraea sp. MCN248]|uniref:Allantoate amidohydrolase n=1 Tax=Nonomuraea corallina TaxID=2989783 RepID=A0ABT4SIN0_9ACTN|nr:allantoate amidohydrolase [Nonomuraea corallina]MDA0637063.1 allantoate amidohydrolase [Nonomuraea corallina]
MLDALAHVGRDPATGGYVRDAWSDADLELRAWFAGESARRGLDLTEDRNGNLWAWWGDPDGEPGVVTGSHLDSVRQGGAYDGPLGVVSAFAALDLLRERGFRPRRALAVVCFTDEEGARFGVPCVGSRLLTGAMTPERALGLTDDRGDTLADVLTRAGRDPRALGPDPETLARVGAFVELHVEQGRALAALDRPVGVGRSIWPHGRWRFDLRGRADHAGTTRLADRDDPMLLLARLVPAAREAAVRHEALATVGKVLVTPNNANAVPGHVAAWLDARGPGEESVRALVREVVALLAEPDAPSGSDLVAGAPGEPARRVEVREESWTPLVEFDRDLRERVARAVEGTAGQASGQATGHTSEQAVLATGAGHDAGILAAAGVPAAMLFVRNPTGVSHAPEEHAEEADCRAGVIALADVLEELCR